MKNNDTQYFSQDILAKPKVNEILCKVYDALLFKGYDPRNQLIGYIMSGDPTYITSYDNARSYIMKIDRDELLEEILNFYIECKLK